VSTALASVVSLRVAPLKRLREAARSSSRPRQAAESSRQACAPPDLSSVPSSVPAAVRSSLQPRRLAVGSWSART
jgi:hypothetical protein